MIWRQSLAGLCWFGIALLLSAGHVHSADVETPLADAAQRQELSTIRVLLDKDADVNAAQDSNEMLSRRRREPWNALS